MALNHLCRLFLGPAEVKVGVLCGHLLCNRNQEAATGKGRARKKGANVNIRAYFIEQDKMAFAQLENYASEVEDVEVGLRNARLEDSVEEICGFIDAADASNFPFIFIDPKGWTGFSLDVIRPLLELSTCEVLINFMTQHIVRFIDNDASRDSFARLFGSSDFGEQLQGIAKEDRVDAAVFRYRDVVSAAGAFQFSGVAGILNPLKARSHFHLIYLSRDPKGLEVFKEAEKKSMVEMESGRASAQQASREAKTKQRELFSPEDAPESEYYLLLRERYQNLAMAELDSILQEQNRVSYDDAWLTWLQFPMVWESDLKNWIRSSPNIEIEGLGPRQRVPRRGEGHSLVRPDPELEST